MKYFTLRFSIAPKPSTHWNICFCLEKVLKGSLNTEEDKVEDWKDRYKQGKSGQQSPRRPIDDVV